MDETQKALKEAITSGAPWTAAGLAKKIGASPQQVHQWVKGTRPVPALRAIQIEQHCGVAAERLNPTVKQFRANTRGEKEN